MENSVGVRFKTAGKIYDFCCGAFILKTGDHVIVETENGMEFGTVATPPKPIEKKEGAPPLKRVYRQAAETDFDQMKKNADTEKKAFDFCRQCLQELQLGMNLFRTESNFDGTKLTFFFTAESRVDFRKLVKLLVKEFRTKIEMRQVGIRNQAKMCGGIGRCGRELCCAAFLTKFDPVSIRMAKHQGLSLNPTKISGVCGRLMCCLTFENDVYEKKETKENKDQRKG
ncbi:MAG: stage 0 sporulation protein [Desulfobacteraceae bacterium]|nr:MAG: stage 0 sporulation protein [Desulfobacteraceae bacterium]